jgi:glycosyltransferase involved in cell wall biosynthesis
MLFERLRMRGSVSPRRVLYVVSLFPCWSETFIVREIRALIEDGVDVRILSLKPASETLIQADAESLLARVRYPRRLPLGLWNAFRELLRNPVDVLGTATIIVAETWRRPAVLGKSLMAMLRGLEHLPWLREFAPELIHAHWATYPSTAAWALGRITGRPFGFTSHAHDIFVNQQLLSRKLADSALAVTISRHNVEWFNRNVSRTAPTKLEVVHCGVDLDHIDWRRDGRADDLILSVGRLDPIKGFDTLIGALAQLRMGGARFRCRIIGDGPLRGSLEALVRTHGLHDCVELAGAQPQNVVRSALEEATLFVLPCQVAPNGGRDGIPVALMEAMAAGCAVVSCPVSGIPELIDDDEHGLLVPERDPAALAAGLKRLLDDAQLRERLSAAARGRVEREFDARKEARRLVALMGKAVADVA